MDVNSKFIISSDSKFPNSIFIIISKNFLIEDKFFILNYLVNSSFYLKEFKFF